MAENQELVGGRYRVLGKLGKGAMGVVFMAHDPVLDRKVAIKQMTAEIASNEDLRQRFYVEARAAARLNHPHIITIHELQEADGEIYMVMELLEGKSVASLIESKPVPLPLEVTLDLMAQVCDGLDYAHQHAIVHRDIKPANLFITATGVVKILDFGIARLGSLHMTATGALVGTPDYMSPEQVRGDEIDRRTDLWAAGAVMYQLLSGAKPFEGRPLAKLLMAITQTPHMPLHQRAPALPKSVCDLADRLLAKPRDQRPASAAIVRDELRAILGRDTVARPAVDMAEEYGETLVIQPGPRTSAPRPTPPPPVSPAAVAEKTTVVPVARVAAHATEPVPAPPPVPAAATVVETPAPALPPITPPAVVRSEAPSAAPAVAPGDAVAAVHTVPAPPPVPLSASSRAVPAPSASPAPKRSKTGLILAIVAVLAVLLVGSAAAAWWLLGPRLLEMAGVKPADAPATEAAPATGMRAGADAAIPQAPAPAGQSANPAEQPAPNQPPPPLEAPAAQPPAEQPPVPQADVRSIPATTAAAPSPRTAPANPVREAATAPSPTPAAPTKTAPTGSMTAGSARAVAPTPPTEDSRPPARESAPKAAPRATEHLTEDTVATFSSQRSASGSGSYGAPQGGATVAAINRITYVLEQYAGALTRRDAEAVREYRPSLSSAESQLLSAQRVSVRLENVNVQVDGTSATARCRRVVEAVLDGGNPLKEQATVTFSLTRRPSGWVITDIR
jgi:eukaryotic-like serine/threonine-protein kinase